MEMSRLTWDGTAEPVSGGQIIRRERGQGNIIFPCSAGHEQDWQPYPVDPSLAKCIGHTYINDNQCKCAHSNGEFLPDIILLALCYDGWGGTRLYSMKIFCPCRQQPSHLNFFIFPPLSGWILRMMMV